MDFGALTVAKKVNARKTNQKVSSSKRIEREDVITKPKLEMKNFNITMYKKVYQGCDKCGTETIHIIKELSCSCIYCNESYTIKTHNQYKPIIPARVPYINGMIFF